MGWILGIVGFILTLIAIKYIADVVADRTIFNNMLIAVILTIAGLAIGAIVLFSSVFSLIGFARTTSPSSTTTNFTSIASTPGFVGAIASIVIGLVVVWIFFFVASFFLRSSYNKTSLRLNVGMFRTAALVYVIGAGLTIILVGFIVLFIAQILFIVAFFSIQERVLPPPPSTLGTGTAPPPPPPPSSPTSASPTSGGTTYCPNCGTAMPAGTAFCPSCGAKQTTT